MGRIYEAMSEWFEEDEWTIEEHEEEGYIATGIEGENANWRCYAQAAEDDELFAFYAVAPVKVPEDRRTDVAEFITRANYGMRIGNFELDYEDGEVRYKTSVDVEGSPIVKPIVQQCVMACVTTADRYFPALAGIVYGQLDPQAAIAQVEGQQPPTPG